jgi:hypothetical protein
VLVPPQVEPPLPLPPPKLKLPLSPAWLPPQPPLPQPPPSVAADAVRLIILNAVNSAVVVAALAQQLTLYASHQFCLYIFFVSILKW